MTFCTFLSLCLVVLSTFASSVQIHSSPVTLPIAVKVNAAGGSKALISKDQARARALYARGQAKADWQNLTNISVPVTEAAQLYVANVSVGAGTYSLIVDTGSSNTWVGAGQPYQPGPYSYDLGESVHVAYSRGMFSGEEFIDTVTLGSASIYDQSIGSASTSIGFEGFDGVLGIGPTDLTINTTSGGGAFPTVTDNMKSQGLIAAELVGVSFAPTTSPNLDQNGELDFGAVNSSSFTGSISFVPITNTNPACKFWGIEQSVTYGINDTLILSSAVGIVDTGTTLLLLATDAFSLYQQATGAILDQTTGLLTVADPNTLQSLFFIIGGTTLEFTANAQMWPRALNGEIGGDPQLTYLIVNDLGTPSGQGLDFINGFVFLQRFYSVFDTDNSQVGLATTSHTFDLTN